MQPFSVAMSGRALTAAVLCASQQNKARLVQFYQQHNPDKLKDVHPPPLPKPLEPLSCADHTRRVSENAVRLIAGRQNAQSLRRPSERPLARPRQGTLLTLLSRPPWAWSTRMRDPGNMSARVVTRNVTRRLTVRMLGSPSAWMASKGSTKRKSCRWRRNTNSSSSTALSSLTATLKPSLW